MKKGVSDLVSFVVVFVIIVIIALSVNISGVKAVPAIYFDVEGVTRFQSCDITLLTLLNSEYDENYDIADAIALGKEVDEISQTYLSEIYGEDMVTLTITECNALCVTADTCCSQQIPDIEGNCVGVELTENK
jgi:hypothetical protein